MSTRHRECIDALRVAAHLNLLSKHINQLVYLQACTITLEYGPVAQECMEAICATKPDQNQVERIMIDQIAIIYAMCCQSGQAEFSSERETSK